ncbi:MAG: Uma2 family endonuclease [Planctomycetaceae bacterium]
MSSVPVTKLSPEEYLRRERLAEFKSEFYRGETFATTGASRRHNLVAGNIYAAVHTQLRDGDCEAYGSDMRVHIAATGLYTYPDITIACGQPKFVDGVLDTLLNPKVLFEVLSDSTEKYDRGVKSGHYRQIESLQEYVLVSQNEPRVEVYERRDAGTWLLKEATKLGESITIESLGVTLPLEEVYRRVTFAEPANDPTPQ